MRLAWHKGVLERTLINEPIFDRKKLNVVRLSIDYPKNSINVSDRNRAQAPLRRARAGAGEPFNVRYSDVLKKGAEVQIAITSQSSQ